MQLHFLSPCPTESPWLWHKGTTGHCGWGTVETKHDYYKKVPHLPPVTVDYWVRPDVCSTIKIILPSPNNSWKKREDPVTKNCRWLEALMQAKFNLWLLRVTACRTDLFANGFTRYKLLLLSQGAAHFFSHHFSSQTQENVKKIVDLARFFYLNGS